MKKYLSAIALILALIMIVSAFAACSSPSADPPESESESAESTSGSETGKNGENETESEPDIVTDSNGGNGGDVDTPKSDVLPIVENANSLANGVQAYFPDATRKKMTFENLNMSLEYALSIDGDQQVSSLKNKNGNSYIENTMDVFITMKGGKTYYGSKSYTPTSANIYRFGYYFYEMRFEDQNFANNFDISGTRKIAHNILYSANDISDYYMDGKDLCVTNSLNGADPYVILGEKYLNFSLPADKYQFMKLSLTADENAATNGILYLVVGDKTNFNSEQYVPFTINNDGQPHEYLIPLTAIKGYEGAIKGIRIDISGAGATYKIHGVELVSAETDGAPTELGIARVFNTYSDKLHQVLQVAAKSTTTDIEAIGFITEIKADTVSSLIIINKDGSTLSDIAAVSDWSSVSAVGFDVKDAGVFGYILPYDGRGGTLEVTLTDNGIYRVIQSQCPENGTIIPSRGEFNNEKGYYDSVVPNNGNDFYLGNRIYTDDTHSFDGFIFETYCETNPLADRNFTVSINSTDSTYLGYDSLRGIYKFSIGGSDHFNEPYFNVWNKHYNATFSVRGDAYSRRIYVMSTTTSGALESAVLLDENRMLLPVPMEVGKNFSEATGERNLYNINDDTYGETIFPIIVDANAKSTYSIINLYQNWGRFPLKQISWIQAGAPYYHLSTGVSETNCILPWYTTKNSKSLNTLPDFRPMSAPLWEEQPQHSSCGIHTWLYYNDANGMKNVTSENIWDNIDSYGPTYVDVKMDYISDDGKMKLSYVHSEMPQTDENRTFYEIKYEVLEDITINDFKNNFRFYSVSPNNPTGNYTKIGYLDENNVSQVVSSVANVSIDENGKVTSTFGEAQYFVLGDDSPYFSFFDMDGGDPNHQRGGYSNVAFLVYDYEFIICGQKSEANFIIKNSNRSIALSLNLGDVTLKKGDTFSINAIVLPWGSQELEDGKIEPENNNYEYDMVIDESTGALYMDKNVRDVRENTIVKPVKINPGKNAAEVESVFVPKVRTTNGKNAEFTVTGGQNNIAVRVYGFEKLTAPVIEEYIDGNWVEYVASSSVTPDTKGYLHYYDGYMVYYDGDGTYSYSFVFDMNNGERRRFRVSAEKDFEGWMRDPVIEEAREDLLDVFVDQQEIYDVTIEECWVSDAKISDDESFVSLFGTGPDALNHKGEKVVEGYFMGYRKTSNPPESGHLLVLKYRIPTTNQKTTDKFEIFTSTVNANAAEINKITYSGIEADGEWHIVIFDLSKVTKEGFTTDEYLPAEDGKYYAKLLRFDFFDKCMDTTDYIDLAYIGIDNSLEDILKMLKQEETNIVKTAILVEGNKTLELNVNSGSTTDISAPTLESFIHPDCKDYTASDLDYAACVDGINGKTLKGGTNSLTINSVNINNDPITLKYNGKTISAFAENCTLHEGPYLVISGWTVIDGGVSKYVYSVDGGKTWIDCQGFGLEPSAVSKAHLDNAANRIGKSTDSPFTTDDDKTCGLFQGLNSLTPKGIAADLSAHIGKTVHVIFAAVPARDTSTLCLISYVTDVKVVAAAEIEKVPQYNEYVKEGSGYSVSDLQFAACIDRLCTTRIGNHVNSSMSTVPTISYNSAPMASANTANNTSTAGHYLVFSGWAIVRGGIEKYVWSADGGNTWQDAECYTITEALNISDAILNHDRLKGLGYTFTKEDGVNCMFQSSSDGSVIKGFSANLENFAGQTVDVIFAAVPKADTSTLCVISVATGVQVPN